MSKMLTTEEWIQKVKLIHGDRYDYSKAEYKGTKEYITIICKIHGEFKQLARAHLQGSGCRECFNDTIKLSQEEIIRRFKKVHGDKYNYSKVKYSLISEKVCIICLKHGEFWQTPQSHLAGCGCNLCGQIASKESKYKDKNSAIEKAKLVHGDKYDYSEVKYTVLQDIVTIICPIHGEFKQVFKNHLHGNGCSKCNRSKPKYNKRLSIENFIQRSNKIHNYKYDYSKTVYINSNIPICIICPEHGEFWQTPTVHLQGSGCKKCSFKLVGDLKRLNTEEFIKRSYLVHGINKYDYSKVKYIKISEKVEIICKKHGSFWQQAQHHLNGTGCPLCNESKNELKIRNFLDNQLIKYTTQEWFKNTENPCKNPKTNCRLPFDFYLPEYNLCIEYDGEAHYIPIKYFGGKKTLEDQQRRDSIKNQYCKDNGIRLLRIPYWNLDYEEEIHHALYR